MVCYFQGFSIICLEIYGGEDKIYSAICKLNVNGEVDPVLGGEGGMGMQLRIIFVSVLGVKTNLHDLTVVLYICNTSFMVTLNSFTL